MGNACCGSKDEASKATAFDAAGSDGGGGGYSDGGDPRASSSSLAGRGAGDAGRGGLSSSATEAGGGGAGVGSDGRGAASGGGGDDDPTSSATGGDPEQLRVVKQEQARLEWIVQATGRRMLGVRSNRGSQGYYVDQGFAAALYQHLEQTTPLPSHLPSALSASSAASASPPPGSSSAANADLYRRLTAPTWESIRLRSDGYGGGGKDPEEYLDHVAETFLDEVVPKKSLFAGAEPLVENLI
jgi:hypothetical protein